MNVAAAAAGRLTAGAAKVSVMSSALFGSISGSASANVASTGAVTLPAMLRLGYPRALAAAVEAVASSGGQIMPPLMGAGAFVMVELTGVPYDAIMARGAACRRCSISSRCGSASTPSRARYELRGPADEDEPDAARRCWSRPASSWCRSRCCCGACSGPAHAAVRRLPGDRRRRVALLFTTRLPRSSRARSPRGWIRRVLAAGRQIGDDRLDHPVRLDHHRRARRSPGWA